MKDHSVNKAILPGGGNLVASYAQTLVLSALLVVLDHKLIILSHYFQLPACYLSVGSAFSAVTSVATGAFGLLGHALFCLSLLILCFDVEQSRGKLLAPLCHRRVHLDELCF